MNLLAKHLQKRPVQAKPKASSENTARMIQIDENEQTRITQKFACVNLLGAKLNQCNNESLMAAIIPMYTVTHEHHTDHLVEGCRAFTRPQV